MSDGYKVTPTLFASLAKGGSLRVGELVDYPGIIVRNTKETRDDPWEREIEYKGRPFRKVEDAIKAWTADGNDLV